MTVPPLHAQVVVVTGAARGLGALMARKLADRGARVALVGLGKPNSRRPPSSAAPRRPPGRPTSPTWSRSARWPSRSRSGTGGSTPWWPTPAIAIGGPLLDSDPAAYNRVIEVNLLGSVTTARAFLPALIESRGYLLQIASLAAITPAPLMSAYCASKAGVESFAHALRAEVAHQRVKVGVGYLSWTDTDMVRGADQDEVLREMRAKLPGLPTAPIRSSLPWTGWWPGSPAARRTSTPRPGCAACSRPAGCCRR